MPVQNDNHGLQASLETMPTSLDDWVKSIYHGIKASVLPISEFRAMLSAYEHNFNERNVFYFPELVIAVPSLLGVWYAATNYDDGSLSMSGNISRVVLTSILLANLAYEMYNTYRHAGNN